MESRPRISPICTIGSQHVFFEVDWGEMLRRVHLRMPRWMIIRVPFASQIASSCGSAIFAALLLELPVH